MALRASIVWPGLGGHCRCAGSRLASPWAGGASQPIQRCAKLHTRTQVVAVHRRPAQVLQVSQPPAAGATQRVEVMGERVQHGARRAACYQLAGERIHGLRPARARRSAAAHPLSGESRRVPAAAAQACAGPRAPPRCGPFVVVGQRAAPVWPRPHRRSAPHSRRPPRRGRSGRPAARRSCPPGSHDSSPDQPAAAVTVGTWPQRFSNVCPQVPNGSLTAGRDPGVRIALGGSTTVLIWITMACVRVARKLRDPADSSRQCGGRP